MAELPITRGVFLCETVIVEEGTRNFSLINCFTQLIVESFPSPLTFSVFAVLTNGNGTMPLRMTVFDPKAHRALLTITDAMTLTDPMHILRPMVRVKNLSFPAAGVYEITLDTGGEYLATTRLELIEGGGKS